MTFWLIIASLMAVAIYILLILHILHTKFHSADEALVWILTITLLPAVGWIFYLFFGITRLKHTGENIIKASNKTAQQRSSNPQAVQQWDGLMDFIPKKTTLTNSLNSTLNRLFPQQVALANNKVELLCDGVMAYPRMFQDIEQAKHCIRLESFIITGDEIGKKFFNLLQKKADEGVDVKILFDSFGSFYLVMSHLFKHLSKPRKNFKIKAFSPLNLLAPWKFQLRNHRKLLVIDGKIAYCGGINISSENERLSSVPKNRYIHDLHCRITGPAVAFCTRLFLRDWAYTMRHHSAMDYSIPEDFPQLQAEGDITLRMIDSGPGANQGGSEKLFFTAAAVSKKSLYIMTPYFVPGDAYINALIMAASRGVDVRIIVPANNNHHFVDWASRSFFPMLLEGGVRVFERQGLFSHTKALLVDHEWGFMGSSNCDNRSFQLNFELDFCFEGEKFSGEMSEQFSHELEQCSELQLNDLKTGVFQQIRGQVCALIAPIL